MTGVFCFAETHKADRSQICLRGDAAASIAPTAPSDGLPDGCTKDGQRAGSAGLVAAEPMSRELVVGAGTSGSARQGKALQVRARHAAFPEAASVLSTEPCRHSTPAGSRASCANPAAQPPCRCPSTNTSSSSLPKAVHSSLVVSGAVTITATRSVAVVWVAKSMRTSSSDNCASLNGCLRSM